jgi:protoporphyrinogen oxidase
VRDNLGQEQLAIIIGGGPAGLTCAYELSKNGVPGIVLESDHVLGGIARTVDYKGYLFDIGGHRFFTKWDEVQKIWDEILGDKFLRRPRLSRIYYSGKMFLYPLKPFNTLFGLGAIESVRIIGSYLRSRIFPYKKEENVEQWVSNRFGRRLYGTFFKTYTEKVWGMPCTEIRAEWAAQRIKGLSLISAVRNALLPGGRAKAKTLIDEFQYPERGPGQMWEMLAERIQRKGQKILKGRRVTRICHAGGKITHVVTNGPQGQEAFQGAHFVSSMPIRDLIRALDPPAPPEVRESAEKLRYRDFLIVSLILNRANVVPDNWIYIHEPGVRVGRIQNFKNWSPSMVPDASKTCLGMEYFVFENDDVWSSRDSDLVEMAKRELVQLGLAKMEEIEDGTVVRMPKAYPIYDTGWTEHVDRIRHYLQEAMPNLQLVGRNGMHKYNNQDHSMMTALYAARNILGEQHDVWAVNTEPDYHEEKTDSEVTALRELRRPAYAEPPRIEPVRPAPEGAAEAA